MMGIKFTNLVFSEEQLVKLQSSIVADGFIKNISFDGSIYHESLLDNIKHISNYSFDVKYIELKKLVSYKSLINHLVAKHNFNEPYETLYQMIINCRNYPHIKKIISEYLMGIEEKLKDILVNIKKNTIIRLSCTIISYQFMEEINKINKIHKLQLEKGTCFFINT